MQTWTNFGMLPFYFWIAQIEYPGQKTYTMIQIISYVDIAFFYRKANSWRRWSNILCIFNENKGLYHSCRFIDLDENLHAQTA